MCIHISSAVRIHMFMFEVRIPGTRWAQIPEVWTLKRHGGIREWATQKCYNYFGVARLIWIPGVGYLQVIYGLYKIIDLDLENYPKNNSCDSKRFTTHLVTRRLWEVNSRTGRPPVHKGKSSISMISEGPWLRKLLWMVAKSPVGRWEKNHRIIPWHSQCFIGIWIVSLPGAFRNHPSPGKIHVSESFKVACDPCNALGHINFRRCRRRQVCCQPRFTKLKHRCYHNRQIIIIMILYIYTPL